MTNFKSPYFSLSISEFWRTWHISLSSWFRDYVYIPLGGNRKGCIRKYVNTLITFLLSGLWHGANVTFVFWGGIHGLALIIEDMLKLKGNKKFRGLSILMVFLVVTFAWIFFRVDTLHDASYILQCLFWGITNPIMYLRNGFVSLGINKLDCAKIGISLVILCVFDWKSLNRNLLMEMSKWPKAVRWGIYYFIGMLLIIYCFQNSGENQFVYFQF